MPQDESDPHPARTYPSAILTRVLLAFITAVTRRTSNIPDIPTLPVGLAPPSRGLVHFPVQEMAVKTMSHTESRANHASVLDDR